MAESKKISKMISKNTSLSIFFPCYNDSFIIKKLVEDAFKVARQVSLKYEVIVVDDCSIDNSKEVLTNLAKKYPNLELIFHQKNLGYGGALKSGFKSAKYELVFYTDGDGQYDVKELPILLSLMNDDTNFVNGIKIVRKDPTYRIFLGNLYSLIIRWMFWVPIFDIDCDFRLIRKELLDKINLESNSGAICIELVKKAQLKGASFRQVSVHHFGRRYGSSQFFHWKRLLATFFEIIRLWVKLMILKRAK